MRVTTTELSFGYSAKAAQMNLSRSQLDSVEVIDHINGLCEWGGWGIRKQLPSWETGYLPRNGSGIRITMKDEHGKEKAYTFICNEAEKVANILTG